VKEKGAEKETILFRGNAGEVRVLPMSTRQLKRKRDEEAGEEEKKGKCGRTTGRRGLKLFVLLYQHSTQE